MKKKKIMKNNIPLQKERNNEKQRKNKKITLN